MENQDKKRIIIIEAALKRFAHYGLSKTTMSEIAKDISLSKALLYYYFPDKISLYVSTMEHLMQKLQAEVAQPPAQDERVCAGTLISREQYLHDVEQLGYTDGRLTSASTMTESDVATWTAAIPSRQAAAAGAADAPAVSVPVVPPVRAD